MNRRGAVFIALGFLLLFVAVLGYQIFSKPTALIVHLRCAENVSGKLSAVVSANGETGKEESFDLAKSCQSGKIEISDYQREKSVRFTFERANGEKSQIVSEYGKNIQSDENQFYLILKITQETPFIANDGI